MSTWASNIQWDDSVIKSLTGANTTPAPTVEPPIYTTTSAPTTTAAPSTLPATLPPTTPAPPIYSNNPGFGSGSGGVVFPLPVAPSLLMDGDISALNPITDAPTTMAATTSPPTLPPMPQMMSLTMAPTNNSSQRKKIMLGIGGIVVVATVFVMWKKGVFKKLMK